MESEYPTPVCFTIGHSNHSLEYFLELLSQHRISCLVDVRSAPYSKYVLHFNKEPFSRSLAEKNIAYRYLGDKLGGLPHTSSRRSDEDFAMGIAALINLIHEHEQVALMCSEKDPLKCHRSGKLTQALIQQKVLVQHILADGSVVIHTKVAIK